MIGNTDFARLDGKYVTRSCMVHEFSNVSKPDIQEEITLVLYLIADAIYSVHCPTVSVDDKLDDLFWLLEESKTTSKRYSLQWYVELLGINFSRVHLKIIDLLCNSSGISKTVAHAMHNIHRNRLN